MTDFSALGLDARLVRAAQDAGFDAPTPIQAAAIPLALQGRDVLGLAQTGTGKTAAFGLPLIQGLLLKPGRPGPGVARALILAPTRELVNQISDTLKPFAHVAKLRVGSVVGGQSLNRQVAMMRTGLDVLVATPGRLIDLMERGAVDLSQARHLVLDEADHMLDMGFIHALRRIAPALGRPRHTMMFSATMPKEMEALARDYLHDPRRVEVSPPGRAADKVEHSLWYVPQPEKAARLKELLSADPSARTLIFGRTKHGAEKLMEDLVAAGFDAASIHGNKSQGQRDRAIAAFRSGAVPILVATDVAARGIDIPAVAYVYNFELPNVPDNYVHRIGRTARAGREGQAISLVAGAEIGYLRDIEKVLGERIAVAGGERPREEAPPKQGGGQRRGGGGRPGGKPKAAAPAKPTAAAKARPPRRNRRRRAA